MAALQQPTPEAILVMLNVIRSNDTISGLILEDVLKYSFSKTFF